MDWARIVDKESGALLEEQVAVLRRQCPGMFEKGKLRRHWRDSLADMTLSPEAEEELRAATKAAFSRVNKRRAFRRMLLNAKKGSLARYPHEKFCRLVASVPGVVVTGIRILDNNDTYVEFSYKGNSVTARCVGRPLSENPKFLPTYMTTGGETDDVTGLDIRGAIEAIPPRRFVYKGKRPLPLSGMGKIPSWRVK